MKSIPQLSVIMPVKNAASTVDQAIRSILESSLTDFEFIIVDDASTDSSASVINQFSDSRIRFLANPTPGLCHALNLAVSQCSAPFIARMDADDISYRQRFEWQLDAAEKNNWDVVGGKVRIIDRAGKSVASYQRYERWINDHHDDASIRAYRFVESPIANPTSLARRSVYDQPFTDGPFPEDYEFWLQAMRRDYRFGKVDQVVLDWIDAPTRTTRNNDRYSPEAFDHCRRQHLLQGPLLDVDEVDVWGVGITGKPWIRWLQSQNKRIRQMIDVSPRRIGQTIHQTKVIAPSELAAPDDTPLIVAVGAANARVEIEAFLKGRDYRIGAQVWFVA